MTIEIYFMEKPTASQAESTATLKTDQKRFRGINNPWITVASSEYKMLWMIENFSMLQGTELLGKELKTDTPVSSQPQPQLLPTRNAYSIFCAYCRKLSRPFPFLGCNTQNGVSRCWGSVFL